MSKKEREAVAKSDMDLRKRTSDEIAQNELNNAQSQFNQGKITQEQFDAEKLAIERDRLQRTLDIQLQYQSQRQSEDAANYANELTALQQSLDNKEISYEAYINKRKQITEDYQKEQTQTELDTQTTVQATLDALNANGLAQHDANERAKTEATKREADSRQKIREVELQLASTVLNGFANLLTRDEKMRKEHGAAIKALQISEILVNSYGEISGYWKGYANEVATKGTIAGAAILPLTIAQTVLAGTRTAFGIAQIAAQPFAGGGLTVNGYNANPMNISRGGFARSPRYGLVGEKGAEYVAPNWQIKAYPELFSMLEANRITGALPFATGGFTPSINSINQIGGTIDMSGIVEAVVAGVQSVQVVTTVQDISIAQSKYNQIVDGASF